MRTFSGEETNAAGKPIRNTLHAFHFHPADGSLSPPRDECFESRYGEKPRWGVSGDKVPYYWKRPRAPGLLEQVAAPWTRTATKARLPDGEADATPRDACPCRPASGKLARLPAQRGCKPWRLALAWLRGLGLSGIILSCSLGSSLPQWEKADPPEESSLVFAPKLACSPLYLLAQYNQIPRSPSCAFQSWNSGFPGASELFGSVQTPSSGGPAVRNQRGIAYSSAGLSLTENLRSGSIKT